MRHNPAFAETDPEIVRTLIADNPIVAGPHGYISPSWYVPGATPAPTR